MKHKPKLIVILIAAIIVSYLLLSKGLENKTDPLWITSNKITNTNITFLEDKEQKLQRLFDSINPNSKKSAFELISSPFFPTISWEKFEELFYKILHEKKIILSGVTGAGKTTIINRISILITGEKSQIIKINCIEGVEKDLNQKWIGYYNKNGFNPGKLLELFERCKKHPQKKYVLLIDDLDKVYRTSFFGEAVWNKLGTKEIESSIVGYPKKIVIPDNLYMISSISIGASSKVPFTPTDIRRLSNGEIYNLAISSKQLKNYLTKNSKKSLTTDEKKSLNAKLYYFLKINEVITEKVGEHATIGQWNKINKLLKKDDFEGTKKYILSSIKNFTNSSKITDKDFENIQYSIENNGKLKGSNWINSFSRSLVDLGIFSEFTVAFLFALFSYIGFLRKSTRRKNNLKEILIEVKDIEKKFLKNEINYNTANGYLYSINEEISVLANENKVSYIHANYIKNEINESIEKVDFIQNLGRKSSKFKIFMKIVLTDDEITKEEYKEHLKFLKKHKNDLNEKTYQKIKKYLTKLHYKNYRERQKT